MDFDVFISYSHEDKTVADAIVNHLENDKVRCWYAPRDILPGVEWAEAIMDALKASRVMVLVFTDDSNRSVQVRREVEKAVSYGLTIIPFKLTANEPSGAMEYYLSTLHWLDAINEPLEKAIEGLCARVLAILRYDPIPQSLPAAEPELLPADGKPVSPAAEPNNTQTNVRFSEKGKESRNRKWTEPGKPLKGVLRVLIGIGSILLLFAGTFFGLCFLIEIETFFFIEFLAIMLLDAQVIVIGLAGAVAFRQRRFLTKRQLIVFGAVFLAAMLGFAALIPVL